MRAAIAVAFELLHVASFAPSLRGAVYGKTAGLCASEPALDPPCGSDAPAPPSSVAPTRHPVTPPQQLEPTRRSFVCLPPTPVHAPNSLK
ncbi:hypothetical protein SPRG_01244 [Saprolegnia parasitica CBS 223.65]|uniref:Secreted protein n=1 Tax=Saprolegnia parasitica (strain CBS 223.65) TaxID=695850 RepID=A0A067CTW5_SAPPC|nr:hypothetical protein SPRG_01244 [Saprolegnia parasitica CBS 223.65]KDO33968.1 hypothetical protein SPRG_01244 [Saprolegnia parasitica CBS 223.65]|eukprot:XP_012194859.1 hypothetical protein SPRG_01244 [Saprolegnia parasitica CBS 223.65]